jgi:hypothetical protein
MAPLTAQSGKNLIVLAGTLPRISFVMLNSFQHLLKGFVLVLTIDISLHGQAFEFPKYANSSSTNRRGPGKVKELGNGG